MPLDLFLVLSKNQRAERTEKNEWKDTHFSRLSLKTKCLRIFFLKTKKELLKVTVMLAIFNSIFNDAVLL